DGRGDAVDDHFAIRGIVDQAADLRPGDLGRVVLRDLCGLAHDLGQRPERDAVAVGKAPTAEDQRLARLAPGEVADQPGLSDAGVADDRDDPGPALPDRLGERAAQDV